MGEALRKACTDLDGWDDPVLMDAAGAISCRLLVGLLWFFIRPSTRPLELTAPQVSRLSSQQQLLPGMFAGQLIRVATR
jgi:hypothetical protein